MTHLPVAAPFCLREKLAIAGAKHLSDTELLAIVISSGSGQKSCLQLASELMSQFGDLRAILNASAEAFQQIKGLGQVRYLQLQAAREICRRSDFISLQKTVPLTNSRQTHEFIKRQLRDRQNETFAALFLDSQYRVICYEELFQGTINLASVHPRPIIQRVLAVNAAAIIIAHNHPSGVSDASCQDISLTKRLRHALELVDAQLLDHIIIGDNEIYSIMNQTKSICH